MENRVGVECPHGYDVCPICDPCTCQHAPRPAHRGFLSPLGYWYAGAGSAVLAILIFPWPLWLVPPALVILFALVDTVLCHIAPK